MITLSKSGRPEELKKAYGEDVGEKFSSAWRAYLASLAEQNSRSGLLARAMVDKDIEVIEVADSNQIVFLEPINKKLEQNVIYTWSKKGSLLTLTAAEAVKCGIADKIVNSRKELLAEFGAEDARIITDKEIPKVRTEFKRAQGQLARIRKSVDFKVKKAEKPLPVQQILKILRGAENEFKALIRLAKKYPDLNLNIQGLEDELNSIKAASQRIKRESKKRR
jgi:hypothetical protein